MQNNGHAKEKLKEKGLGKMHANLIKVVTEADSKINIRDIIYPRY